jgi:uncharacterized membrane protein YbhN (UPF0104 family)
VSTSSLVLRLARWVTPLLEQRARATGLRGTRIALAVAVVIFLAASIIGVLNLPEVDADPRWELLVLVGLVGVPLMLLFNAVEYQVGGSILGYRIPFGPAVRVSVIASAANVLPVPGAVLVRAHAMWRLGASFRGIALSTAAIGVCFVGTAAVMGGAALVVEGNPALGSVFLAAGFAFLVFTLVLVAAKRGVRRAVLLTTVAVGVEAGSIAVKGARFYLVMQALGYEAGAAQALALTLAAVLATALGFFPGGLGAAELFAAAMSPLVGLSPAVGLVTSALDRVITMTLLAVIAGAVTLLTERRGVEALPDSVVSPPSDR